MGVADKMWDAITAVIKMNDKVERLSGTVKAQQDKIKSLTERAVRLEAFIEVGLVAASRKRVEASARA